MNYVKTKSLLDDLMYSMPEKTPEIRRRMLSWLNAAMQMVVYEPREWFFLRRIETIAIANNAMATPLDFDRLLGVGATDYSWYMDCSHQLTPQEAFSANTITYQFPVGWTINHPRTYIAFHPAAPTGNAYLVYQAGWPGDYPDSTDNTIIPLEFTNLLQRAVLSAFYETDQNTDMIGVSLQLDPVEMKRMKALDNRRSPSITGNSHAYLNNKRYGSPINSGGL